MANRSAGFWASVAGILASVATAAVWAGSTATSVRSNSEDIAENRKELSARVDSLDGSLSDRFEAWAKLHGRERLERAVGRAEVVARSLELQHSRSAFVPIGGIVAFWGTREELEALAAYEVCDGREVSTARSPILGRRKPDLVGRFIRGGASVDIEKPETGGADTHAKWSTLGHSLTKAQMPRHRHNLGMSKTDEDGGKYNSDGGKAHHFKHTDYAGEGQPHSHEMPTLDNRPAYLTAVYLIRVL